MQAWFPRHTIAVRLSRHAVLPLRHNLMKTSMLRNTCEPTASRHAKGGLLQHKKPSFIRQKTANGKAKGHLLEKRRKQKTLEKPRDFDPFGPSRVAFPMCKKMGIQNILALPHLSGTARGAIVRRFPKLESIGATAENIAEEYAREIIRKIQ